MEDSIKALRKAVKQSILYDPELHDFLEPFFTTKIEREKFVEQCLKRMKTRRMLLRTHWYVEIADSLSAIEENRPALRIIFLISAAEGVQRLRENDKTTSSDKIIKEFFKFLTDKDKKMLLQKFKRTLLSERHHKLRISSIVSILWDIRNRAVHGDDFYSFSLLDENRKKEVVQNRISDYGMLTEGFLGKRGRKRRVSLDISLTYSELRAIIVRTALQNIQSMLG